MFYSTRYNLINFSTPYFIFLKIKAYTLLYFTTLCKPHDLLRLDLNPASAFSFYVHKL